MGHLAGVGHVIRRGHVDLVFAVLVGEPGNVLAVRAPYAFALVAAGRCGDVVDGAVACGQGEQVAAGDDEHALRVGREAEGEHLAADVLVFGTAVDVVAVQVDRHLLTFAGLHVVLVDVTAVLENDVLLAERGELAVIFREVRDLARLLGLRVVDEEVHGAVAVGEVIDFVADPHREDVLGVVVRDLLQLRSPHLVDPDVVGLAAAVVFPSAEFAEHPVEGQLLAVGRVAAEAAFRGRNLLGRAAPGVDFAEPASQAAEIVGLAAVDDLLSVGRPAHDDVVGAHAFTHHVAAHKCGIGHAHGFAARHGHGVDFGVAVVLAGEGDGFPVGGDAREHLIAHVRGQPHGGTAIDADTVEVACIAEDDVVAANCGESEQAGFLPVRSEGQQRDDRCKQG